MPDPASTNWFLHSWPGTNLFNYSCMHGQGVSFLVILHAWKAAGRQLARGLAAGSVAGCPDLSTINTSGTLCRAVVLCRPRGPTQFSPLPGQQAQHTRGQHRSHNKNSTHHANQGSTSSSVGLARG